MGVIGDLVRAVTVECGQAGCSGFKITGERGIGNRKYGLFGKNSGVVKFVSSFRILPPGGKGQYACCLVVVVCVQQCGDGS